MQNNSKRALLAYLISRCKTIITSTKKYCLTT
ncbi:hypothetical protein FLHKCMKP_CDS0076 [Escherichia phage KS_A3]